MLAGEVGHDPTTYGLTDRRYYQLSYTPIFGWAGWTRTNEMQESKSCAVNQLGYCPKLNCN